MLDSIDHKGHHLRCFICATCVMYDHMCNECFMFQRHLDKGGDLLEEASQVSGHSGNGLRDLARSLKNHLRGFSERLEDTRERLEDTSRCFYLLDKVSKQPTPVINLI